MLTDPKLHSQIDQLWDKLWTGGLSNPMDAIEQLSYLIFLKNAEFKINKPSLLIEACKLIDQMQISAQNQDVQGDLYEYLLSKLTIAGRSGQFRTPRHIIRMMVQMIAPRPGERISDLAAGDLLASWRAHGFLHVRQLAQLHWEYVSILAKPHSTRYAEAW